MSKYQIIYADPPWSYGNNISNGAAKNHYETMSLVDLKRLPVWQLADDNAVLFMWYTGTHVSESVQLAEAWGFDVRTMLGFVWVKINQLAEKRVDKALQLDELYDWMGFMDVLNAETRMNGGNYTRANAECCLIAVRGAGLERCSASVKQVVFSCLGEHSEKPWEVRRRIEQLYGDVPRIELFSRKSVPGWDHFGNECDSSVELVPSRFYPLNIPCGE